jgi:hypothetical protein
MANEARGEARGLAVRAGEEDAGSGISCLEYGAGVGSRGREGKSGSPVVSRADFSWGSRGAILHFPSGEIGAKIAQTGPRQRGQNPSRPDLRILWH